MFGYRIDISQHCINDYRSPEEWGEWSEEWDNNLSRTANAENAHPSVVTSLEFVPGSNALVVWAEWNTGDSFGNATNRYAEVFGMFKDMASAIELRDALEDSSGGYSVDCSDGQKFRAKYVPWNGYFESLSCIHIEAVTIW